MNDLFAGMGAILEKFNFSAVPINVFHVFHTISEGCMRAMVESSNTTLERLAWENPDSPTLRVRTYEFLKEMAIVGAGRLIVLRLATKYGSNQMFLQAIEVKFIADHPCNLYSPNFVSEVNVESSWSDYTIISMSDQLLIVMAMDKQKSRVRVIAVPLLSHPRLPACTCRTRNGIKSFALNILPMLTGLVRSFNL